MSNKTVTETKTDVAAKDKPRQRIKEHIVEIVSDSGEGAQKAAQTFGSLCAKMGNGVWTVEIIPAEIKPPSRSPAGASGNRIRFGTDYITNQGDKADFVVAFNEQVLYGRIANRAFKPGTTILLESKWSEDPMPEIREQYQKALKDLDERGFVVREVPMEKACKEHTPNPQLGKNMFVLGILCHIYDRDLDKALEEVGLIFAMKSEKVIELNRTLVKAGYDFARETIEYRFEVPAEPSKVPMVVTNGNQAVGLGIMASGMELLSMYPITPATSATHYISGVFQQVGGFVHQAEDEIAAIGFGIGSSYAGKTACTVTSGPGMALKMEFLGLAIMTEIPLVIVDVQRGGPSTGLPTKIEQADLWMSVFGSHGDAPRIVMAAATIEECFHFMITARKLAEAFRGPVIVLTDANLATGVQPYPRPVANPDWFSAPIDQSPWKEGVAPYEWDEETGLSPRPIPGQRGGEYVLTGLSHTKWSKVAYDPDSQQRGCDMRSRKLAAFQRTLNPPKIHGDEEGDLLVVGWGSTMGAIDEAVDRIRAEGNKVSSIHLRFLSPLEPGLEEIFKKFKQVMTVELNYSDDINAPNITPENRRRAQLATVLRGHTLMDIECWSKVPGQPLHPFEIFDAISAQLDSKKE
jgi:2-oxoglutarate ferredoxin oxidoreductase subunit alpha